MRKVNRVNQILRDLKDGFGSQRLPDALQGIDVIGVPTARMSVSHRQLVKRILPRMKYNNQRLSINVEWRQVPTKKGSGQEASTSSGVEEAPETSSAVLARLHFNGLPTEEFRLPRRSSSTKLAQMLLDCVARITGVKIAESSAVAKFDEVAAAPEHVLKQTAESIDSTLEEQLQSQDVIFEEHEVAEGSLIDDVTASEQTKSGPIDAGKTG